METENVPDRERKEQRLDVRAGLVAHASLLVLVQVTWASGPLFWSFVALPVISP